MAPLHPCTVSLIRRSLPGVALQPTTANYLTSTSSTLPVLLVFSAPLPRRPPAGMHMPLSPLRRPEHLGVIQPQSSRMPSSPPQTTMNPQLGHLHGCSSSGGYASHVLRNILFLLSEPIGGRLRGTTRTMPSATLALEDLTSPPALDDARDAHHRPHLRLPLDRPP